MLARTGLLAALALSLACNPVDLKPIEETGGGCRAGMRCSYKNVSLSVARAADVLFVVDNSGSMAASQARLARGLGVLVTTLTDRPEPLDLRIGFTTTDNGNPACTGTAPEGGALVLSSCRDRIADGEFTFAGTDPPLDGSFACTEKCAHTGDALVIQPTTTARDPEARSRPWVEHSATSTNLPPGTDLAAALACFAPQGIAGCGFESPLESMFLAITRTEDPAQASYDFLREGTPLAVVLVTDEVDCSANAANKAAFVDEKALWNDPGDAQPTSAVCWRAGITCTGDPDSYESCVSADVGVDGSVGVDPLSAVLHPLSRYRDLLEDLEVERKNYDVGAEVILAVLGGVPPGYSSLEDMTYSAAGDPAILAELGVDPGCTTPEGGPATPPVRLRELAEALQIADRPNLFSICEGSYEPALAAISEEILRQRRPACMPECVKDMDPNTPQVDAECTLTAEDVSTGEASVVPPCEGSPSSPQIPSGHERCYVALGDRGGATLEPGDDIDQECLDIGWNLQFRIIETTPLPSSSRISVACVLSDLAEIECPDL